MSVPRISSRRCDRRPRDAHPPFCKPHTSVGQVVVGAIKASRVAVYIAADRPVPAIGSASSDPSKSRDYQFGPVGIESAFTRVS
jgi:hypothetical protein